MPGAFINQYIHQHQLAEPNQVHFYEYFVLCKHDGLVREKLQAEIARIIFRGDDNVYDCETVLGMVSVVTYDTRYG